MIESHWDTSVQIPMLFHSKIPARNGLIPACDDATQESASAFMLVQHLCHHWHHRADLVDEKATEGPHDLQELNTLKWYIKKKSHSKYLSLKVISVFLYKHFALAEAVWTLSKIYKILSQNLVSCCTVWFLQELKRQRFFNKVRKLLLPAGEKTQTVGFSLMLPPCFPPLLCLGLESVL